MGHQTLLPRCRPWILPLTIHPSGEYEFGSEFYAMAHVSRYVPSGSRGIKIHQSHFNGISSAAFLRPDQKEIVAIANESETSVTARIHDLHGHVLSLHLTAKSALTLSL